ncbi:ATP-dependent helicase [Segetibacter sp. 3557_3]|uniref:UvrD-helicase domain-containing protein n=1 Tax=Segetibacter sp. 3557_3 TaxID=2547429 RepID=UPI0010585EEA|nr:UvrD-helicase domain-containing protein [Segetibacter sp. 3557_3]TDH25272.1 ATP-dependent helicase [Segetibacter sp. 3557_3]
MKLTAEQEAIVNSTGNIKINAVAGSGKTTTIIQYAKSRPASARILYLAFNKSVKLEAAKKFAELGMTNVHVETAHSIAFRYVVARSNYKVRAHGYRTHEIAGLLGLEGTGEKHAEYIAANHISKFITYFCNSDKQRVSELNYLDVVSDAKARIFVSAFYSYIERQARILLAKMEKQEIEITHDFYLKKFQLQNPALPYEYILFDEGQDASSAMLDIFLKQDATKVIVGDTHQQIYGWRYAVNSLEKVDFKTYNLTTSFRFRQDIADLAASVLNWKSHLEDYRPIPITGSGNSSSAQTKAVLGRTNLGVLLKAIQYTTERKDLKHLYFEGNISSYTYADEGASLYDVLNLHTGSRNLIRDELIKAMGNMDELEEYIEKTEDVQLGMMVEIVKEYVKEIPQIIRNIKEKHVPNDEKEKAEMIFTTVHRCKGMEYDAVQLVSDFITEERLEKAVNENKEENNKARLREEVNLLYVAITRTRKILHIPEALLPDNYVSASPDIHVLKKPEPERKKSNVTYEYDSYDKNSYYTKRELGTPKFKVIKGNKTGTPKGKENSAGQPWTAADDAELTNMYLSGESIFSIAKWLSRTHGSINARIKKLRLKDQAED